MIVYIHVKSVRNSEYDVIFRITIVVFKLFLKCFRKQILKSKSQSLVFFLQLVIFMGLKDGGGGVDDSLVLIVAWGRWVNKRVEMRRI